MAGQEEDEGLDALIKQKISRPSFARVISHELTRSPDDVKQSKITISKILKQLQVIIHILTRLKPCFFQNINDSFTMFQETCIYHCQQFSPGLQNPYPCRCLWTKNLQLRFNE